MTKPTWKPARIRLGQLKAWDNNPRMSNKAQAQRIIASERKFGQPVPFLVAPEIDGVYPLLDGHQRLAAWFTVYGAEYEMDAMVADRALTPDEHKELVITLHTGATGSWDWNALSSWGAGELQEWGMNGEALKGWNNDANNLKELLNAEVETEDAEPQIDRAAELQEKWGCKSGDLWELGVHRLLIGDCTVRENVDKLMSGERAELVVTDPPYKIDSMETTGIFKASMANIKNRIDDIISFEPSTLKHFIENGFCNCWYIYCNKALIKEYIELFNEYSFNLLVWCKTNPTPWTNGTFLPDIDYVLFFSKSGSVWNNSISPTSVYSKFFTSQKLQGRIDVDDNGHPTIKPLELISKHITISSSTGGIVVDMFAGSGTTIIAAHNLSRRCFAMEISPAYGGVILERFFTATGIAPELQL